MMLFICCIVVIAVAMLLQDVSGTTSIRSHYSNGDRVIKGERLPSNDIVQQRRLQKVEPPKKKKHTGNIVSTLDEVFNDASSVDTKVKIQTKCKKPKKSKKDGAAVNGDGVGVVGGGKGSGKGSGKGGSRGSSTDVVGSVTSNTTVTTDNTGTNTGTSSNATDTTSNNSVSTDNTGTNTATTSNDTEPIFTTDSPTTNTNATNANSETTTSTIGSNSTNATRWLQTNTTDANVFENKTSSTTNSTATSNANTTTTASETNATITSDTNATIASDTNTTITSDTNATSSSTSSTNTTDSSVATENTPNSTFVVTVGTGGKGGKTGKKGSPSKNTSPKVSADDIPFCDEEDGEDVEVDAPTTSVTAPSVPISAPVESPAAAVVDSPVVASPAAAVGSPAASPAAVDAPVASSPVQSPAMASPIVSIPLTMPSSTGVVTEASVCEAYRFGAAPTDAPSQNHTTFITMNVDVGTDIIAIYSQMGTMLREKIGPLLLDCASERRLNIRRKSQENATEVVNVDFTDLTFSGATCAETPENATCVPSKFVSEVYYFGEDPVGFDEKIRQAMLFSDFDIPGLQSFTDVDVSAADTVEEIQPVPVSAPVSEPVDRGVPTTASSIETTRQSRSGPSPGVSVAVAVSVLALVLAAVFVVRRHRETSSSDSQSKHIEFTDDFPDDAGAETADDISANSPIPPPPQPKKSYVVGDESLDESWNTSARRGVTEGQEVYAASTSSSRQRNYPQTTFVEADGPDPRLMNLPRRFYEASDTVNL